MTSWQPFLEFLEKWEPETQPLDELLESHNPAEIALLGVDLVEGFCSQGPLASERVAAIVDPIARLCDRLLESGVTKFFWPCDRHPEDSPEFQAFPPHCIEGTVEAEMAKTLREHRVQQFSQVLPKKSVSSLVDTELLSRLENDGELRLLLCVGDCTDLCLYQMALGLRHVAICRHLPWRVAVVQGAIDTYDLPVETAASIGALPHPGDFFHQVFLYHMVLQGIEVVKV